MNNPRDTRRIYCSSCNKFPFKNDEQKCCNADDKAPKSLEALAKEVESGVIRAEDLVNQRYVYLKNRFFYLDLSKVSDQFIFV